MYKNILKLAKNYEAVAKKAEFSKKAEPEEITTFSRIHLAALVAEIAKQYNNKLSSKVQQLMNMQSYPSENVSVKISQYIVNAVKNNNGIWVEIPGRPTGFIYDSQSAFKDASWGPQLTPIKNTYDKKIKDAIFAELNRLRETINFGKEINNHVNRINLDGSPVVDIEVNF